MFVLGCDKSEYRLTIIFLKVILDIIFVFLKYFQFKFLLIKIILQVTVSY